MFNPSNQPHKGVDTSRGGVGGFVSLDSRNPEQENSLADAALAALGNKMSKHRINEEDFVSAYGKEAISAELSVVNERRRDQNKNRQENPFDRVQKKFAKILEQTIVSEANRNWFGEESRAWESSTVDDLNNGVDAILQIKRAGKPVALAMDATFSRQGVEDKISKSLKSIFEGKMTSVKYFKNDDGSVGLNNIPRLVVGISKEQIKLISQSLIDGNKQKNENVLKGSIVEILILEQIVMQLDSYSRYALAVGRKALADELAKMHAEVKTLFEKRKIEVPVKPYMKTDPVHSQILEACTKLNDFCVSLASEK